MEIRSGSCRGVRPEDVGLSLKTIILGTGLTLFLKPSVSEVSGFCHMKW